MGLPKIGVVTKFNLTIRNTLPHTGRITVKMCSYQRNELVLNSAGIHTAQRWNVEWNERSKIVQLFSWNHTV